MVLSRLRPHADRLITPFAKFLGKAVKPDAISWIAFLFAVLASFVMAITRYVNPKVAWMFLILFSAFVIINAYLDGLDGVLARLTQQDSKKGDLLDHVLDRYADIFIFGGIVFSPYCNDILGLIAIIGILLTSYMGTQAQAIGVGRVYGGLLGRGERLVVIVLLPIIHIFLLFILPPLGEFSIFGIETTIIELGMLFVAVASNFTAVQRAFRIWRHLK